MEQLDLRNEICPLPLIKVKLWLKKAAIGQAITVIVSDTGSRQDIPRYLIAIGQDVTMEEDKGELYLYLRKLNHNLSTKADLIY